MAWDSGPITSNAPWTALIDKIKAMCGTQNGGETWEYVGNVPAGTGAGQSGSDSYSLEVFRNNGTNSPPKDINFVNVLSAATTNDQASYTFSGVGPIPANVVVMVAVVNSKASNPDAPQSVTLDGSNAPTFTSIVTTTYNNVRGTIFIGKTGSSAPTGTNLTVNFGTGNTQTGCIAFVDVIDGLDTALGVTGLDPTGQTQIGIQSASASGSVATLTPTFTNPPAGDNCVYAVHFNFSTSYTPSSSLSYETAAISYSTPTVQAKTYCNEGPTQQTVNFNLSGTYQQACIMVELKRKYQTLSRTYLNPHGVDWYLVIEKPVPDGAVNSAINCCTHYNNTMKTFMGLPPAATTAAPAFGSRYFVRGKAAYYASVTGNNRTNLMHQALNTTGFNYFIKMTSKSIMIATVVGAASKTSGAVMLDSFVTGISDPWPLMSISSSASAGDVGNALATLPGVSASMTSTTGWQAQTCPWTIPTHLGIGSNAGDTDMWLSSKIHVGRIFVGHSSGIQNSACATRGGARGLFPADYLCIASGGTISVGQTMAIGSQEWSVIAANAFLGSTGSRQMCVLTRAN